MLVEENKNLKLNKKYVCGLIKSVGGKLWTKLMYIIP